MCIYAQDTDTYTCTRTRTHIYIYIHTDTHTEGERKGENSVDRTACGSARVRTIHTHSEPPCR